MTDATRTLVAMGGGGFMMEPDNPLLDDYLVEQGRRRRARPRICFLATATGDSPLVTSRFHEAFQERDCDARHLSLFGRVRTDVRDFLLAQDVIYVGGGNTANMLAIWRVHGVDRVLREAWETGVVLCGLSAGMICWYEAGVTDSFGPLAGMRDGLGFLSGSACPHMDGEADRRPAYHQMVVDGFPAGVAADDGAALVYHGTEIVECVSSRAAALCYRVTLGERGTAVEEPLPVRYLGE